MRAFPVRPIVTWTLIVVALLGAAYSLNEGFRKYDQVMNVKAYDLLIQWAGAKLTRQGMNPYTDEAMKTLGLGPALGMAQPPTVYFWFLPLADLDLQTAKRIWNLVNLLLLILLVLLLVSQLQIPVPLVSVPLIVGCALSSSWMVDNFRVSQVSVTIAFLLVLAWYELRQGREVVAGLALGVAATFKFYPGVVAILLFVVGRRRAAIAAGATWAAFAVAATAKYGFMCWPRFFELVKPYTIYWMAHLKNASLQGIFQRFRYPTCVFPAAHHETWKPGSYAASLVSLGLIVFAGWVARRGMPGPGAQREAGSDHRRGIDLPFALFTLVSLITGPYYWEHYHVTLLLPLAVGAAALVRARHSGLAWSWVAAGAAALLVTVYAISVDFQLKLNLWDAYHYRQPRPSHFVLHFFEVMSFIGAPLLIVLLALLLVWERKRARGVFADLRFPTA